MICAHLSRNRSSGLQRQSGDRMTKTAYQYMKPLLEALEKIALEDPSRDLTTEGITFDVQLPKAPCTRCGNPAISDHPDRPGGITYYSPLCEEHVRIQFGLVPICLKPCRCGAWAQYVEEWCRRVCGWDGSEIRSQRLQ